MKTVKILLVLMGISLVSYDFAQTTYLGNYSVDNHLSLCDNRVQKSATFDSGNGFLCQGGQSRLYYSFSPATTMQLGALPLLHLSFSVANLSGTAVNTTYALYGPFNQGDHYSDLIAMNSAPVLVAAGTPTTSVQTLTASVVADKFYILEVTASTCSGKITWDNQGGDFPCSSAISCDNCIPKFQPIGDKYVVSAWVKEEGATSSSTVNYTHSQLKVTSGSNVYTFAPSGQIIDGWQRIEGLIETNTAGNLKMELIVSSGTSYFDDIRVFPYNGSMMTYVYDPVTLRLMAELDERNYAKIYEYDEEGKLIRVKKETEKGIMTIQENRENSSTNY